jgi:hypothetical protein
MLELLNKQMVCWKIPFCCIADVVASDRDKNAFQSYVYKPSYNKIATPQHLSHMAI